MKKPQFLQNKIFIKWVKYNCITIIIGVSAILNIIYLPKYFSEQNSTNQNISTITIQAINSTDLPIGKTILTKTIYITTFKALGQLLNACSNEFQIKKYVNMYLNYLYGVTSDNNKKIEEENNDTIKDWWQIEEYSDGVLFVSTPMGIDDTSLTNNTHFQFELTLLSIT